MRLKDKYVINNFRWSIHFAHTGDECFNSEPDEVVYGITHFDSLSIYINLDIDKDLWLMTIRHELCHAYMYSYGFDQVDLTEEIMCDIIGVYGKQLCDQAEKIFNQM